MIKITKEDLDTLKFDGIIVSVPRNIKDGQQDDISFIVECSYYTQAMHGYKVKGYKPDNSSFYHVAYNTDVLPQGLWLNSTSRFTIEHTFCFESYDYYKFEDMKEFCTWYLQNKNYEIWSYSNDLKGMVSKITPNNVTDKESVQDFKTYYNNLPKTDKDDFLYKLIAEYDFAENDKISLYHVFKERQQHAQKIYQNYIEHCETETQDKTDNVVDEEENFYWEMYNDYDDEFVKELILKVYPQFKNMRPSYLISKEEISRKLGMKPLTRRTQLADVLTLLGFTYKIDKLTENLGAYHPLSIPQHIVDEISEERKRMDEWLDEKVY